MGSTAQQGIDEPAEYSYDPQEAAVDAHAGQWRMCKFIVSGGKKKIRRRSTCKQ